MTAVRRVKRQADPIRTVARPSLAYLASQRVLRTAGYVPRFTVPPHAPIPDAKVPICGFCREPGWHASIRQCQRALGRATGAAKRKLRRKAQGPR